MMSCVVELLDALRERGIGLVVENGDALRVTGPGRLSETLRAEIQRHKAQLLESLAEAEPADLSEAILRGERAILVRCSVLGGEEVRLLPDDAKPPTDGKTYYRVSELKRLLVAHPAPEVLRMIHAIKKELGGVYTGIHKETAPKPPETLTLMFSLEEKF